MHRRGLGRLVQYSEASVQFVSTFLAGHAVRGEARGVDVARDVGVGYIVIAGLLIIVNIIFIIMLIILISLSLCSTLL